VGEKASDVCFRLRGWGEEVEAQNVKGPQKWPDVGGRDGLAFNAADDLLEHAAMAKGLLGDEAAGSQVLLEFGAVARAAGAVEQPAEVLE
jgi:hypothetical protein